MARGNLPGTEWQHPGRSLLKHPERVGVYHFGLKPELLRSKTRENVSSKLEFPAFQYALS